MNTEDFVTSHLPGRPSRVLEVGCGSGELARALASCGHNITAIDPEAPEGPMFHKTSLEEFRVGGPFDAVVASRSLHHIPDLAGGLDKIRSLLRRGGVLILNEFAWDQMDAKTARWYLSYLSKPDPEKEAVGTERFLEGWIAEHDGLHDSTTLLRALEKTFHVEVLEWVPYIAQNHLDREELIDEESNLIRSEAINALGFRYVGTST
jgi:SAM-dependent methyltransferase